MHKYVLKRLLMLIPVIIGVTFVVFFILNLAPGDPAAIILGDQATAEALAMKREELGLNDPIFVRYFHYMWDLLHEFGRDMLLRMLWGARYSLFTGGIAILLALCAGGILGALSGYYGGAADTIIMRTMDVLLAIPSMLLATAIVAALGTSLWNVMIAIAISYIPTFARTVRAAVLTVKDQEFIEAARSIGCNNNAIIFQYIIPNALAPIIVQATLGLAGAILSIAGLSFLGLGIQPPTPEWGAMLSSARVYIRDAWHVTVIPGLGIMLTILSLNLMGDGLRDAMDPKLKN